MPDNLLETVSSEVSDNDDASADGSRPQNVPDKFWDEGTSQVRVDAMAKSYSELERKFGGSADDIPNTPDGYEINSKNETITPDAEVNARLHEAGFSQKQVQMVYDLASDKLLPMVDEIAAQFEMEGQVERLVKHFGGKEKWQDMSHQLTKWGKSHFPEEVYHALSTTHEGILAMHHMMGQKEPGMIHGAQPMGGSSSEAEIREIMADPRYWRDHEPNIVAQVRNGFKQLYRE